MAAELERGHLSLARLQLGKGGPLWSRPDPGQDPSPWTGLLRAAFAGPKLPPDPGRGAGEGSEQDGTLGEEAAGESWGQTCWLGTGDVNGRAVETGCEGTCDSVSPPGSSLGLPQSRLRPQFRGTHDFRWSTGGFRHGPGARPLLQG